MSGVVVLSYNARLLCLCLAAGFYVYLATTLITSVVAPWALRRLAAARLSLARPARAAAGLLALRLAPLAASLFFVAALCLPSYLWLEPHHSAEHVGWGVCLAALAGAVLAATAAARGGRALFRSWRFARHCARSGQSLALPGAPSPALIISDAGPLMALVGILRPRLLVSRAMLRRLPPEQLEAGLRHERAHGRAHDNLKRLLLVATPTLPGLRALDRTWARFAEWAADDAAVALPGDGAGSESDRSLALASALLAVARMGSRSRRAAPTMSCLSPLAGGGDLADRVQRLLAAPQPRSGPASGPARRLLGWSAAALLVIATLQPGTLVAVHEVLEHLLH